MAARARRAGAVALLAAALLGGGALHGTEPAQAGHGKTCRIVSKGKRDYRVRALKLSCRKAERGAKRYLRNGKSLRRFSCTGRAGRTEFFCRRGKKAYWAVRL